MNCSTLPKNGIALLAILFVACGGDDKNEVPTDLADPPPEVVEEVRATGAAAADALMKNLGGQLKAAMESGGPVNAIGVCQQVALPMTAAAAQDFEGVTIQRTTLKPRNPANAADSIDLAVLEKMATTDKAEPPTPVIEWQEQTARYYQPLMIKELCLKCHGDPAGFSPELVKVLAERYPADQATGYQLGDFRGAIRVDIPRP